MFFLRFFRKKKSQPAMSMGPYRDLAPMPKEEPPKPKKVRKPFVNPFKNIKVNVKLTKPACLFLYMIPICLSVIGAGFAHDSASLTEGLKWGAGASSLLMGAFFGGLFISKAYE
jgi:hypothetical protein